MRDSSSLSLSRYDPADLSWLAAMLSDAEDLRLVWPDARHPFDRDQWRETLTRFPANECYQIMCDGSAVGHAALLETEEPGVRAVSYLYIEPGFRGRGLGLDLMRAVETQARTQGHVRALRLRVRSYNPRAQHVYRQAGFREVQREGTLITMRKELE